MSLIHKAIVGRLYGCIFSIFNQLYVVCKT
jgi:hypothetical protein